MDNTPQTLRSRLYHLQTINQSDMWMQQCQGFPIFKKQQNIYRFKFISLPQRQCIYQITVDTNIHFDRNQSGIQWTQIKENQVMAISFKEDYGANAFWALIQDYQRKYAITVPAAQGILFYFEYKVPDPKPENLVEFLTELEAIPEPERHQRVVSIFLTKRDLLPKLVGVFKTIDQSQDLPKLEIMFKIMKLIFNSSNEQLLYELMCNDSYMSILGALQYDTNFKCNRPKHREFMRNKSRLLQVVPFAKSGQMLNLIIFTYRLQYVKQCVLFPYLNDYSFTCTNYIIKGNYRKILNQIFNQKKKDFINSLFDLLRVQDVNAFKLLREIFRIGKNIYVSLYLYKANDIYTNIAEKDFFDIMMRNVKELTALQMEKKDENAIVTTQKTQKQTISSSLKTKKKKPQQIEQITTICFQILEQFMEFEPHHFRVYCINDKQKLMKYPTFTYLFEQFDVNEQISSKLITTLKMLISCQQPLGQVKSKLHQKILCHITASNPIQLTKWLPLFHRIMQPVNDLIIPKQSQILLNLLKSLVLVSKDQQIYIISIVKMLMNCYFQDYMVKQQIVDTIVGYFVFNKGAMGIRISCLLAIFNIKKFRQLARKVLQALKIKQLQFSFLAKYIKLLQGLLNKVDVQLPPSLKRQKTQDPFKDDQCFDKLDKKIKTS